MLQVPAGFETIVLVVVQRVERRERSAYADAGQRGVAGSIDTEVEVAYLVEKDVGATAHTVRIELRRHVPLQSCGVGGSHHP